VDHISNDKITAESEISSCTSTTTNLWDSSHCSPVLCETRNLLRIFKLSISFVSTPCMACSLLAVSIWIISTTTPKRLSLTRGHERKTSQLTVGIERGFPLQKLKFGLVCLS
jgi:hypothetical protein